MTTRQVALATVVSLGLLAGCSSAPVDKSGAAPVLTLSVGYADPTSSGNEQSAVGPVFIDELRRLFGERLDLVEKGQLGQNAPRADEAVVRAIRSGEIDAGWIATRALSDAGIEGFDALTAPMLLTSFAAEAAVTDPVAAQPFLDRLDGTGLTGLSLAVGGLRRPVSVDRPLLGPRDWAGQRVVVLAESQEGAFTDLGAQPTLVGTSVQQALAKKGAAAELDTATYDSLRLSSVAPYITSNVVLWPKTWVLVVNTQRFAGLSADDQQLVRDAAATATKASLARPHNETDMALKVCEAGARFAAASTAQLAALKQAFEPTIERLAANPRDASLLASVQAIAARYPDADAVSVPSRCTGDPPSLGVLDAIPALKSTIPSGTYRMTLTEGDLLDAGITPAEARENDLVITLTLKADGTHRVIGDDINPSSSVYTNLLWEVGTFTGTGKTVFFMPDVPELRRLKAQGVNAAVDLIGANLQETPYAATWQFANDSLTLSGLVGVSDPIGALWMTAHPFKKID